MDQHGYDQLLAEVQVLQQDLAALIPAVEHVSKVCNEIVPRLVGMIGKCTRMIEQRDIEIARLERDVLEKSGLERLDLASAAPAGGAVKSIRMRRR